TKLSSVAGAIMYPSSGDVRYQKTTQPAGRARANERTKTLKTSRRLAQRQMLLGACPLGALPRATDPCRTESWKSDDRLWVQCGFADVSLLIVNRTRPNSGDSVPDSDYSKGAALTS